MTRRLEPITERMSDELGDGGPWDIPDGVAARESLRRCVDPVTGKPFPWVKRAAVAEALRRLIPGSG